MADEKIITEARHDGRLILFVGESCKKVIFEAYENWKITSENDFL